MGSLSFFFRNTLVRLVHAFYASFLSLTSHINGTRNIQLFIFIHVYIIYIYIYIHDLRMYSLNNHTNVKIYIVFCQMG